MLILDLKSKKSIHEQIVDGIKAMIINGSLQPNEKLQSVRELSGQLLVNPNTIAKAFKTLETQGWIYTVSGRGCFVSEEKHVPDEAQTDKIFSSIKAEIDELLFMGISDMEIKERLLMIIKEGDEIK